MAGLQPTMGQLRPALSLALSTARDRAGGPLPGRVRQIVRSRRSALPPDWVRIVHQALDEDQPFREAVAAEASEEELGRLPWLWLSRPEGWEEEVSGLVEADAVEAARAEEIRVLSDQVAALEAELAQLRAESQSVAATRGDILAAADTHEREAAGLRLDLRRSERLVASLQEEMAELRRTVEEMAADRDAARADVAAAEARVAALEGVVAESAEAAAAAESRAQRAVQDREEAEARTEAEGRAVEDWRREVAAPVHQAATAAAQLGAALSEAATRLASFPRSAPAAGRPAERAAPPAGSLPGTGAASGSAAGAPGPRSGGAAGPPRRPVGPPPALWRAPARSGPGAGDGTATRVRRSRVAGRLPLPLPPAIHDDSVEAAEHLMRVPGSELIVDGYNVAFTSWSEGGGAGAVVADLPSLRHRLIDSLNELALRYQRRVVVVFDGIDAGTRSAVSGPARPLVRVVFSPSTVEADEVIVEMVRHLPGEVPAIVATDDRAVRASVAAAGANVVSVGQLLAVLRRQPSG